jgi:hypothetical protein
VRFPSRIRSTARRALAIFLRSWTGYLVPIDEGCEVELGITKEKGEGCELKSSHGSTLQLQSEVDKAPSSKRCIKKLKAL